MASDSKKLWCPFTRAKEVGYKKCKKEECAWWVKTGCAVAVIAENLQTSRQGPTP